MYQLQFYTCVLRLQQANHLTENLEMSQSYHITVLDHTHHMKTFHYYFVNSHREVQTNLLQLRL